MADQHPKPLAGKVALVTGGAKRLGKAAGLALAKAGADVAITFLASAKEAQQTAKQIENLGVRALAVPCDVTDPKSVRAAIAAVVRKFSGLDILINSKCENHADWKFRFKENSEKMRTGSLLDVAYVLKSLLVLNQTKALSFREKKMLERARYLLVSELSLAKNVDEQEVEALLTKALAKCKLRFPEITAEA